MNYVSPVVSLVVSPVVSITFFLSQFIVSLCSEILSHTFTNFFLSSIKLNLKAFKLLLVPGECLDRL
jgi:hypothetical protein